MHIAWLVHFYMMHLSSPVLSNGDFNKQSYTCNKLILQYNSDIRKLNQ